MEVLIPTPLRSYTGKAFVQADGGTLDMLLNDLDRRYPGIRFRMMDEQGRIRRHIRIFVNGCQTFDPGLALKPSDEISIVQALSGG
jgi:hypothetical protein